MNNINVDFDPPLHQPKTLRKSALNTLLKTTLLNTVKPEDFKKDLKKEVKINKRKDNTLIYKDKRITIETMLTEIYRLKTLMHDLINVNNNPNFVENIRNYEYDYYFVYFNANKLLEYSEGEVSDLKIERLNNIVEFFNGFLDEQYNDGDMSFVGTVITELEEFGHYEQNFAELNDMLAQYILPRDDNLLEYFKSAYENKYSKVLVKLKEFSDYLAMVAHERGDTETFIKIKDLYIDTIDNNFQSFEEEEIEIKKLGAIDPNIRAELLNKVPTIHGGAEKIKLSYGTILVSAIIMGIASMM